MFSFLFGVIGFIAYSLMTFFLGYLFTCWSFLHCSDESFNRLVLKMKETRGKINDN